MLELACASCPSITACGHELNRSGPSYTVDALRELACDGPLVWLIGGDALAAIASWHQAQDLPALCHLLAFDRPGGPAACRAPNGFQTLRSAAAMAERASGGIYFAPEAMLGISSTAIRETIAGGGDASTLLMPEVWAYIKQHGIYGA